MCSAPLFFLFSSFFLCLQLPLRKKKKKNNTQNKPNKEIQQKKKKDHVSIWDIY